jgi:hypothetical protein
VPAIGACSTLLRHVLPTEIALNMSPDVPSHRCAKSLKPKVSACGLGLVSKTVGCETPLVTKLNRTKHPAEPFMASLIRRRIRNDIHKPHHVLAPPDCCHLFRCNAVAVVLN